MTGWGGAPHCGFCGRRFENGRVLFDHKAKDHEVFESDCTRGQGGHGFLMVMVAGGRAHILARGAAAEASLLPVDGWLEAQTPQPVRRIVEEENRSLFVAEGGYLPKTQASLDALEDVYHEMLGWTSTKVGELAPAGVRGGAGAVEAAPGIPEPAPQGSSRHCRACGAPLSATFCETCGLKNE
jgi:hypothetical protein